jgi:DNA-binding NarL/FixJ family response regulator
VTLPGISGFELCHELRDHFGEELPIFFVSADRVEPIDRAVGLFVGADDYIVKPFDADELFARARRAIVRSQRVQERVTAAPGSDLSRRELEVLGLLAEGRTVSEIAGALVISPKTVASHIQRIRAKLGVHSRAQAIAVAYRSGLLQAPAEAAENVVSLTRASPGAGRARGAGPAG